MSYTPGAIRQDLRHPTLIITVASGVEVFSTFSVKIAFALRQAGTFAGVIVNAYPFEVAAPNVA
jgi:hypothetical protein